VRFLDHANRKIDRFIRAKRKLIGLLNEQKQAIIHRAVTSGLDPNVKLKPSGIPWLGDIPQHWEAISVRAATRLIQTGPFGSQIHQHEYTVGGASLINPSHVKDGQIVPDPSVSVTNGKADELSRHKLAPGDVVVARRGELGRSAVVGAEHEGCLCGTGSLLVRLKITEFDPDYFQLVFSSPAVAALLSAASIGATMDNLNAGMVGRLRFPKPPKTEQAALLKAIQSETAQITTAIARTEREIALMQEYRTRLTADLVTGKLDVRAAAAKLPELTEKDEVELDATDETEELGEET
jgi:type I restriction enzyme S subunit